MAIRQLVIAPAAKTDLKDIYQYGLRQWGQARSESFLAAIKHPFWLLTQPPYLGSERSKFQPEIRRLPIESHALYYRVASDKIEIIRVLHGRQDPRRHL